MQLPEVLQVIDGNVIATQVQQGINEHGTMAVGQHKTVTIHPIWIDGIVLQIITPQYLCNVCHTHGGTWVSGFGFLNGVHGKCANGVGKFTAGGHWPCS